MGRRAWTLLLTLGAIWGGSYMLIKIGLRDLSPAMIAWSRVALAAAVLVALAYARGALGGLRGRVGIVALIAVVQVAAPFLLIGAGELQISSSLTGILISAAPLFTAVLALRVDAEERVHGLRLVGVLLGLVGVAILLGVDLGGSGDELLGGLAILGAALGYAVGGLLIKRQLADATPIGVAAWVLTAATAILLPAAIVGAPSELPGLGPAAAIAVLGVLGTGIAFAIFFDLIALVGPARTYLVSYLAPGFAVVYGALLLDEAISVATIAGLALILAGSWLAADGRLRSPRRVRGSGGDPGAQQGGDGVAVVGELAVKRVEGR